MPVAALAVAARVTVRTYERWLARDAAPPAALAQMAAALDAAPVGADAVDLVYRMAIGVFAVDAGISPAAALAADPRANSRGDPTWSAAALCRHRAAYVLVVGRDVPISAAAGVVGVSKQALSKALRKVEDSRDDVAVASLIDQVIGLVEHRQRGAR